METLLVINDQENKNNPVLEKREAVRIIIFDENNLIPLLFVSKHGYHKLPGGGIEAGEDINTALAREVLEEAGCKIKSIDAEVGKIIEYRLKWNLLQMSYCYMGTISSKGEPSFTAEERSGGFEIIWTDIDGAIKMVENDHPANYEGGLIQQRDLAFLKKAKEILGGK
jgi:8-oxo-dGTP pyrophosphatase MutT (NUDIX family)